MDHYWNSSDWKFDIRNTIQKLKKRYCSQWRQKCSRSVVGSRAKLGCAKIDGSDVAVFAAFNRCSAEHFAGKQMQLQTKKRRSETQQWHDKAVKPEAIWKSRTLALKLCSETRTAICPPVLENAVKPSSETQPQLELTLAWRKFDTRQVQWNLMTRHCNSSAQNHSRLKLGINKMIWQCNGWYSGDHDTGWRSAAAAYNQRFLRPTDRSTDRWSDLMKSTTCRSDALQANRSHGTKSPSDGFPIWMNAAPLLSKMLARSACCRLATKKQPPDARAFSAASLPDMPTRPVVTAIKSKDVWEVSTVCSTSFEDCPENIKCVKSTQSWPFRPNAVPGTAEAPGSSVKVRGKKREIDNVHAVVLQYHQMSRVNKDGFWGVKHRTNYGW